MVLIPTLPEPHKLSGLDFPVKWSLLPATTWSRLPLNLYSPS